MHTIDMSPGERWTFARLPEALAELGVEARGIMHIGAYLGEEVPVYRQCGFAEIILVEPDRDHAARLRELWPDAVVEQCAVASDGERSRLWLADDGRYASLRKTAKHNGAYLDVPVRRAYEIADDHDVNVVVIDTQGTELDVLSTVPLAMDLIIVEVQDGDPHLHAGYEPEIAERMAHRGYVEAIRWQHEVGFADALYVPARRNA